MQLSFRGAKYEYRPVELEISQGGIGGIYRGIPWRVYYFCQQLRRPNSQEMIYRGIHYKRR